MDNNEVNIIATGDSIITRRLSVHDEESFLSMVEIIRDADIAFTNLEISLHDYKGYPVADSGTHVIAEPSMAEELNWMGFDVLSRANNHSMNYGEEGMLATTEVLDNHGFLHAGVGRNLSQAREPSYLDTNKGRVSLVSVASTFAISERAGEARRGVKGRAGVNPLRYNTLYVVDPDSYTELKKISKKLGLKNGHEYQDKNAAVQKTYRVLPTGDEYFFFLGRMFKVGEKPGVYTTAYEPDFEGNLRAVEDARRRSDFVIVSLHAHEKNGDLEVPSKFIPTFARACIDAGADIFIGHGPHILRGIEIYQNKPILYSLGNFISETYTVKRFPDDLYHWYGLGPDAHPSDLFGTGRKETRKDLRLPTFESVIAKCKFMNRKLNELKLYPITLCPGMLPYQRGRPFLAEKTIGRNILKHLSDLSSVYGTEIEIKDNIGVVKM